jgi:hypothetical protein
MPSRRTPGSTAGKAVLCETVDTGVRRYDGSYAIPPLIEMIWPVM